jgi:Uma2 family endonuclease
MSTILPPSPPEPRPADRAPRPRSALGLDAHQIVALGLEAPDHTQLPETDSRPVESFLEFPQSYLLRDALLPWLRQRHPDGRYAIGTDSGIYWRWTDPPLRGCKAPDWFYIPGAAPMPPNQYRRSYVLWKERIAPLIAIEYVSGDGSEERDRTPETGKFWVYERMIQAGYYAIFDVERESVEVHRLANGAYQLVPPNERGHYPIAPMGLELGTWRGQVWNHTVPWLRWWDADGQLLPTSDERSILERERARLANEVAERERQRAEQERQRAEQARTQAKQAQGLAEQERQRAERLAVQLRQLGLDPDQP